MNKIIKFFTFKIKGKNFTPTVKDGGKYILLLRYDDVDKDYPILKHQSKNKIVKDTIKEDIYITLNRKGVL